MGSCGQVDDLEQHPASQPSLRPSLLATVQVTHSIEYSSGTALGGDPSVLAEISAAAANWSSIAPAVLANRYRATRALTVGPTVRFIRPPCGVEARRTLRGAPGRPSVLRTCRSDLWASKHYGRGLTTQTAGLMPWLR